MERWINRASLVVKLITSITVGALIAANPVGNALTPDERHFWAAPFEIDNEFGGYGISQNITPSLGVDQSKLGALHPQANTTIGIVATDFDLDKSELKRLAIAAHDGLARAIYPSHLPYDGDLIFAVSTGKIEKPKDLKGEHYFVQKRS